MLCLLADLAGASITSRQLVSATRLTGHRSARLRLSRRGWLIISIGHAIRFDVVDSPIDARFSIAS